SAATTSAATADRHGAPGAGRADRTDRTTTAAADRAEVHRDGGGARAIGEEDRGAERRAQRFSRTRRGYHRGSIPYSADRRRIDRDGVPRWTRTADDSPHGRIIRGFCDETVEEPRPSVPGCASRRGVRGGAGVPSGRRRHAVRRP